MPKIRIAQFPEDTSRVLEIWREFIANTITSLDYQGNETEFANLPGKYAAPSGCVLIAERGERVVGCIAMRPVNVRICEMKRLYVRPEARGAQLGERLVMRLFELASRAGYSEMRLDVLAEFDRAQALYARLGFMPAEPVSYNPTAGALFLGRPLD